MPQQQETIPLTCTSGNSSYGSTAENTETNSASNRNLDTTDTKVYANFFKQKFRQDFPDEFNFSIGLAGGSMNIFKF